MNRGSISCVSIGSEHALHFWRSPRSLYVLGMLTLPSVDGTSHGQVREPHHRQVSLPYSLTDDGGDIPSGHVMDRRDDHDSWETTYRWRWAGPWAGRGRCSHAPFI
jgi:hypothetical protein